MRIFFFALFLCPLFLFSQEGFDGSFRGESGLRIGFYNTENLFDTSDDPTKRDEEFTLDGAKRWSNKRYYDKLNKLSKVVVSVGGWEAVEVMAFCELENEKVLRDLIDETPLKGKGYKHIHYESPDRRGIDVGLIYRPDKIEALTSQVIPIRFPWDSTYKTRDILEVLFQTLSGDSIYLFVNHWPSRWGGQLETDRSRRFVASVLKERVREIQKLDTKARIIIIGDFNDTPENASIREVLNAIPATASESFRDTNLINLSQTYKKVDGTHKYQGEWSIIDQVIISGGLFNSKTTRVRNNAADAYKGEFLFVPDEKFGGNKVNRTYLGMKYQGGYSDHLPVYLDLEVPTQ